MTAGAGPGAGPVDRYLDEMFDLPAGAGAVGRFGTAAAVARGVPAGGGTARVSLRRLATAAWRSPAPVLRAGL
jgi:hypothetical protein